MRYEKPIQPVKVQASFIRAVRVALGHFGPMTAGLGKMLRRLVSISSIPETGPMIMQVIPIEQAEGRLVQIIEKLSPGEEVVLTRDNKSVATIRLMPAQLEPTPRQFGTLKGTILYVATDFDAIPEGFEDYIDGESVTPLP